jgi:DNA-binding MarR family transcriptional regulator
MVNDSTEAVSHELIRLFRGAKDLHQLMHVEGQLVVDPPAFALLARIREQGPIRPSALAGCLYLDLSTISRQVQDLESSGWVARKRDPLDGRAFLVEVTPAGLAVLVAGYEQRTRALGRMLAQWSAADRGQFAAQLQRFNEAIAAFRATTPADTPANDVELSQEIA